ncbi:cytochrome b-c1 complex subunit Rieske, mitochondrial [Diachasma alloeum]|uniref:cytochrome b-c1 complex subunit Rieske, mitochondrial n=1 Tax=Diachasma alloeum TaxID=454923 RepID=UPI0010FB2774|nr:cytochrome b-c1 complex subunit Rieske, mitochondrial [Diachasma alloeum]
MLFFEVSSIAGIYALKSHLAHYVKYMAAAKDVLAIATMEVTLSAIPEGKVSVIKWRGKPVFIYHRSQATIDQEKSIDISQLRDPETDEARVHKPEWLVVIGVCTHLGCVPIINSGMIPGGFYCPCHGSHYDAAGRIRKGPAPTNLEVPTYRFLDEQTILIG